MFTCWLVIFIILLIIEIATINLVSIWFAIGALITAIFSLFIEDTLILSSIFAIVSILTLILTKGFVKKFSRKETIPTNIDRIIGKIGIVTKEISKLDPGEVKVEGKYWTAIASSKIKKDSQVEIIAIDGVKLKVKKVKEEI